MTLLIAGVLLWAVVHLMPAVAPSVRQGLVDNLGEKPYRGVFALLILASVVLIVLGWRSAPPVGVYAVATWSKTAAFVLICIAVLLIGAAHHPTRIKRVLRHPMLTGVALWALAHLLANGTSRAVILFGGIGAWAILEILLINRRDGAYTKPAAPDFSEEMKGLFFSGVILLGLLLAHPYFAGVTPFPR